MQRRLRAFLKDYHSRYEATVLLTSHYMADVVELCPRVVIIDRGTLLYDGTLTELSKRYAPYKKITIKLRDDDVTFTPSFIEDALFSRDGSQIVVQIPQAQAPHIAEHLLTQLPVDDLIIEDAPIEEVIEHIFTGGVL